jgi:hypothetical protein
VAAPDPSASEPAKVKGAARVREAWCVVLGRLTLSSKRWPEDEVIKNVNLINPLVTQAQTVKTSVASNAEVSTMVSDAVDHFFDGMPVFMDALDAVAKIHPFISGESAYARARRVKAELMVRCW